jgi:hypothetical protein
MQSLIIFLRGPLNSRTSSEVSSKIQFFPKEGVLGLFGSYPSAYSPTVIYQYLSEYSPPT